MEMSGMGMGTPDSATEASLLPSNRISEGYEIKLGSQCLILLS